MWFFNRSKRPDAEQVAKRLLVLKYVAGYALTAPPRQWMKEVLAGATEIERKQLIENGEARRDAYWGSARTAGLWSALSPMERELATTTPLMITGVQQLYGTWRVEAAQVLMWTLGMLPSLPPYDTQMDSELLENVFAKAKPDIIKSARLLPSNLIDQTRDLAELWHWRSRTRQLIMEKRPLNPSAEMIAAGLNSYDDIVRTTAKHIQDQGAFEIIDDDFAVRGKAYRDLTEEEWSEV